jgi:hypothetical protein
LFKRDRHGVPEGDGVRDDVFGAVDGSGRDVPAAVDGPDSVNEGGSERFLISRRGALIGGSLGVGGLMVGSAGGLAFDVPAAAAALPTTTAPEQLRLEFGADPTTEVTVSWSPPGTVPMPAPMLAFSESPITADNPGELVFLPEPVAFDMTQVRTGPCVTSFTDGQTAQTTYHCHVPLSGLEPDTTYYYEVSDGAGSTASASFQTAPTGRASFRFTAFGDQGVNPPVSAATTAGVANPGDGNGAPLFHLMVADLAYADGANPPLVWRDWALQVQAATQSFPWMPITGNHEVEPGRTSLSGELQTTGTSGAYYNGPYGSGSYFSRFLLPDNGVTNWDGNRLQGSFYSFQVGTVLFVNLAGSDVIWQTSDFSRPKPAQYTGDLTADPSNMQLVPSGATPNLQTMWLEQTLQAARAEGSGVEMIVVQMHFPAASVDTGNSCDLGARAAWGPLFDQYEVDLVLAGHNHNYCRSLPVRGYDEPAGVTTTAFTNPFGTYEAGQTIDTRRPTVRQTEPVTFNGEQAFDTSLGTVHLVVGGGGAASTIGETVDPVTGLVQAHPFVDPVNNGEAVEDAPWLGFYDTADAYGYAVFDVDPGDGPGQTSITFQWFSVSSTVPAPTVPLEKFVFARLSGQMTAGVPSIDGTVNVGRTVGADPGQWGPSSVALSYQWLLAGAPISGATSDTYTITAADLGQELQVEVTGTLGGYTTTNATSAGVLVAPGILSPAVVTVSGTVAVGGTVTADAFPWTQGVTLAYQWLLNGSPMTGATGPSYSPVASDVGDVLEVQVTGTEAGYQTASVTSVPETVGQGVGSAAAPLAVPKLSATPAVGVTVRADLAQRASATGLAYQWLLDGSPIKGAKSASYTPVPGDADKQLQVKLTARGRSVISKAATVKAAAFNTASRPGFRGTTQVGKTLTAITGRWSPNPTFEYQWLLDGEPIKGETHSTLVVASGYAEKSVSLRVTAKRTGYVTRETTSDAVAISKGSLNGSAPRITGKARAGETLHVLRGDWEPNPEFSYRWLVGGRPVEDRGAGIAYKVRPQDGGKRIAVEVTGRAPGYETVVKTSGATLPVRA